ncbi:MAG: hypothetical protein L6Q97_17155, partial [Thermoanaerobaculia bacterium]|nr:hypothetical protein [Thermoanaerobaculia bacterium]
MIAAAQVWYQNSAYANTVFIGQPLQPDWSHATVSKPKNDRLLIDVPLLNGDQYDMAVKDPVSGQTNPANRNGAVRLVITKFDNGTYIPMLFMVFGTPAYNNQYGSQAAGQNKPHQIQANFSGYMTYLYLDGTPFAGLFVENGQVKATLTGASENSVVPRNCSILETICAYLGEGWLCVHYVLCEVYDDSGIYTYNPFGNNWWWGGGPIQECFGCTGGGGYAPPVCPNGSLMTAEGNCQGITEGSSGECSLTGLYVTSPGPFVIEYSIFGIIPYPWEAYTDVVGILRNCNNGDADYKLFITSSSGGVTLGQTSVFPINCIHFSHAKIWGNTTQSYAQFIFSVEIGGLTFSSVANSNVESYLSFKYL